MASFADETHWRRLVEECFRREAGFQAPIPDSTQDLIETGALDSMAWVSFLRALESASGLSNLGAMLTERTPSLESIFQALKQAQAQIPPDEADLSPTRQGGPRTSVLIASSCAALG